MCLRTDGLVSERGNCCAGSVFDSAKCRPIIVRRHAEISQGNPGISALLARCHRETRRLEVLRWRPPMVCIKIKRNQLHCSPVAQW